MISRYKPYIIFFTIAILGFGIMTLIYGGYYPIAVVNGSFLSAKSFAGEYNATSLYYQNLLKINPNYAGETAQTPASDLQLAAINNLIEQSLIANGARKEAGADFNYLLNNKLDKFSGVKPEKLDKAVKTLYGLNADDFRGIVLIPQAEREILEGRLFLKGEKIEDWLMNAKKTAKVMILSAQFFWNGDSVELKNK